MAPQPRSALQMRYACAALLIVASCKSHYGAGEYTKYNAESGKSLRVDVLWNKHQGDEIHVALVLTNEYPDPVRIDGLGIKLEYDGLVGRQRSVKHYKLMQREQRRDALVYRFERRVPRNGVAKLTIDVRGPERDKLPTVRIDLPIGQGAVDQ